ncbi:MAG: T9SS type A sorting domain-containing protein [Bacteroidota bacterium]
MKKTLFFFFATLLFSINSLAQIAGNFTIPGSFPSIAAAINTLNIVGVAGPVTINVSAGYTENAPNGGYKLFDPPGSSITNQVIFQKSGIGSNPVITAFTGTATPSSLVCDGVWWFIGADNITIDGIDIIDPNTTNPATMEFGYGFYKTNVAPIDGCSNNTIKNCVITLSRNNGAASPNTSIYPSGSRGIDFSPSYYTNNTLTASLSSVVGANSGNKVFSNLIQNCHVGISLIASSTTYPDESNDVGGLFAVTGNTVINFGGSAGSDTYGIDANKQSALNISHNYIDNNNGSGVNPLTKLVAISIRSVSATNSIDVNNNTIKLSSTATSSLSLHGIISSVGSTTTTVNINNNFFPGYNYPNSSGMMQFTLISASSNNSSTRIKNLNIKSNLIQNVNAPLAYGCTMMGAADVYTATISSNTITNIACNSNVTGIIGYYLLSNSQISDNLIDGITKGSIDCIKTSYGAASVTNNTITNVYGQNLSGIECVNGASITVAGNVLKNMGSFTTVGGTNFIGITGVSCSNMTLMANTIYSITITGNSTAASVNNLTAMSFSASANMNITGNKAHSLSSTGTGTLQGIVLAGSNGNINNNIFGDFHMPASNQSVGISAIATYSGNPYAPILNIAHNTFYMDNSVNNGINSGSSILNFLTTNTSFTLSNNIFINTSVATGTAITSIIRRITSPLINFSTASDRNLYYTGVSAANRTIYYDGINNYSTLFSYKSAVAPREANSVTENPPFITTNGALPNTYDIDPVIQTQVESGGAPVAGVTTDYAGNIRSTTTPDIGAWEGNYTQTDVYAPVILSSGFTGPPCNTTSRTMTVSIKDTSGVATGSVAPRLYYRINFGLYSSVQGNLTSGTPLNGIWTFNPTYVANLSDVIYYFLVIQDQSATSNVNVTPSTGASVMDVNNVIIPPSPANNYTLETYPTISVNSGTICSGQNFTITPSGAVNYNYSGGSAFVSPIANSTYTVTGSSAEGCPATNTVVASVTVLTSPTVSVNSGSICVGQSFTLNPSGSASYTYSGGSSVVSPTSTTTYSVTGTDPNGCLSNIAVSTLTVNSAGITASASSNSVCQGSPITLNGGGSVTTYTWNSGITNNISFNPGSTNTYTVSGIGVNGCSGSATIQVIVNPIPTLSLTALNDSICAGETTTLTVNGANSYTWNPGGITSSSIFPSPTASIVYSVTGQSNGCSQTLTVALVVNSCVGIHENEMDRNIVIYPNPSNGIISIDVDLLKHYTVKVFNSLSQVIYTSDINANHSVIELNTSKGIYFIKVYEESKLVAYKKLVISN